MASPAPAYASNDGVIDAVGAALGELVLDATDTVGEIAIHVPRGSIVEALAALRDELGYQQLMEIAGVDWPDRAERFEIVYMLLSLTKNHRLRVHISTDEDTPVPSVTGLWPVAGWLEREVFDMFGVLFEGNTDLRRILTDYGFQGHPFRKDFPLSGHVEMRYSEEAKRVVYEPVQLAQDFRTFDFLSPWEGAEYVLPGDEKAGQAPGAQSPSPAAKDKPDPVSKAGPGDPKVTEKPSDTGAGKPAEDAADKTANGEKIERDAEVANAKNDEPAATQRQTQSVAGASGPSKGCAA